jgi:DNA-binding response OmpR family regulator
MSSDAARPAILVVEDDDQIAHLIRYILEQEGYEVKHAADGKSALALIGGGMAPPALVTLDIALPDMTGVELILQIKDTAGWERVPIVMVTAQPKDKDVNWAIKSGARAYIVKPFKPEELRDCVRKHARKPAA